MPSIRSANPDLPRIQVTPGRHQYTHPAIDRKTGIPMAFQVTSPFDTGKCLLPHALVLHVNPQSLQITHNKQIERIQTRGGWVEQHWGDQLDEISCNGSTGAFMNIHTGLTSVLRHRTIAWDRFRDLHDLYRNNGSVYDPFGNIVLQGRILLLYDMGVYTGTFRTFQFEETAETPFSFTLSWTFKVESVLMQFPYAGSGRPWWGPDPRVPVFQGQNSLEAPNSVTWSTSNSSGAPVADDHEALGQQRREQMRQAGLEQAAELGMALKAAAGDRGVLGEYRQEQMRKAGLEQAARIGQSLRSSTSSIQTTVNPGPPGAVPKRSGR
jgi:hypothetical protein